MFDMRETLYEMHREAGSDHEEAARKALDYFPPYPGERVILGGKEVE